MLPNRATHNILEKLQQNLIEAMFKLAEKKYGRKRPQRGDKGNAMEDYELYLRSIKAKVKTAQDKLNAVLKQKKVRIFSYLNDLSQKYSEVVLYHISGRMFWLGDCRQVLLPSEFK